MKRNITSLSFNHVSHYFYPFSWIWQHWQEETFSCTLISLFISQTAGANWMWSRRPGRSTFTPLRFDKPESQHDRHCCLRASWLVLWLVSYRWQRHRSALVEFNASIQYSSYHWQNSRKPVISIALWALFIALVPEISLQISNSILSHNIQFHVCYTFQRSSESNTSVEHRLVRRSTRFHISRSPPTSAAKRTLHNLCGTAPPENW